ncbi:hypothetical protein ABN584_09290 [Gloeocapsa sp. BRSZ]
MEANRRESHERMSRMEASMEENRRESNERLTRIEQLVESNNRFLESFSADLRRYTDAMNNIATQIDGVIATRATKIDKKQILDLLRFNDK